MATGQREETAPASGLDLLKDELVAHVTAQVNALAERAGERLADLTDNLTGAAEGGGAVPKAGLRALKGESPVTAFVSEKAKGLKDSLLGKAKEVVGGGGGGSRKAGSTKVMNIVEVLDVGVPLRTAYDHWTDYEQFSSFAKGVRSVSQGDETTSDWKVKVGPSTRGWKATVQEQVPDDRIVWTSEGAKGSTRGCVSFHELGPTLTRVVLVVEYYPSGFFEKTGNLWRAQGRRLRLDFKHFQRYVTFAEDDPEGWRGEIRDGEVVRTHEEAIEAEEAEDAEQEEGAADDEDEATGGTDEQADEDDEFEDEPYDGEGEDDGEEAEEEYEDDEEPDEEFDEEEEPEEQEAEEEEEAPARKSRARD
ncbi:MULTISPECIES: SRPBCC family protein [unclassified Streptomyces]|uniref:SRPBCC family protein n=1 Tax=unclassified Streptomyces TaxID=2593676 RepID=UPI00380B576C